MVNLKKIIYSLLLILGNLIIGISNTDTVVVINYIYIVIGIIYYILQLKNDLNYAIMPNKLDLCVSIFLLICPLFPLIFNTYSSLEKSILEIYKTLAVFFMYIITRDLLKEDKKNLNIVLNSLLFSGMIFVVLGYDIKYFRIIYPYLEEYLGFLSIKSSSYMISVFAYKNAFGIYIGLMLLISVFAFKEYNKRYGILSVVFLICLLCSGSIIAFAISCLCIFIYMFFETKNRKKFIIRIVKVIISFIIVFTVVLLFIISKKDVYYFDGVHNDRYVVGNIKANEEYVFKFNLENKSNRAYEIRIRQINSNQIEEISTNIEIESGFIGEKRVKITANENVKYLFIQFCENKEASEDLKVSSIKINNEEFVLKYKYLPSSIVRNLREFVFKSNSIQDRFMMIKAGMKLGLQEPIIGQGAGTWSYRANEFQEWYSGAIYMHSYIIEVFIQYGLIGVLILVISIIISIIIVKKYKDKGVIFTLICLILILLHSSLDFDMKYFNIFLNMFILFGIISSYFSKDNRKINEPRKTVKKILDIVKMLLVLGVYSFTLILCSLHIVSFILKNEDFEKMLFYKSEIELDLALDLIEVKEYDMALELINESLKKEKYRDVYAYYSAIDFSKVSNEKLEEIYRYLKKNTLTIDYFKNLERNKIICKIFSEVENEYVIDFARIIVDENDEMKERINNYGQNKSSLSEVKSRLELQEKQYNMALEKIK